MIYYDRTDVAEAIDNIKDLSFSHLCSNCHDALMMSINLNSIQLLSTLVIIALSAESAEVNPRIY